MILNNYRTAYKHAIFPGMSPDPLVSFRGTYYYAPLNVYSTSQNYTYILKHPNNDYSVQIRDHTYESKDYIGSSGYSYIIFGKSTEPVKPTDYTIDCLLNTRLQTNLVCVDTKDSLGILTRKYVIEVTSKNSSNFTISEIGYLYYYDRIYCSSDPNSSSVSGNYVPLLLDRTLLDSPITLSYNEKCVINYSISIDVSVNAS